MDDEIDLLNLWRALWNRKWLIVAITSLFTTASVVYALTATELYRAHVLLAPAEEKSTQGLGAQLGGLAQLAGISFGSNDTSEAVAVLQSRDFIRSFIEDRNLMPMLFDNAWDAQQNRWLSDDPNKQPDIRDGVKFFLENVIDVKQDSATGHVTLTVTWTDPELAAAWSNELVARVNERMRQRALREAEVNIAYLEKQMRDTSMVTLQYTAGRLLEGELQKAMLARGTQEYSFRVIDRAVPPKDRIWPKRTLIVVVATFLGGIIAVTSQLIAHLLREGSLRRNSVAAIQPLD